MLSFKAPKLKTQTMPHIYRYIIIITLLLYIHTLFIHRLLSCVFQMFLFSSPYVNEIVALMNFIPPSSPLFCTFGSSFPSKSLFMFDSSVRMSKERFAECIITIGSRHLLSYRHPPFTCATQRVTPPFLDQLS